MSLLPFTVLPMIDVFWASRLPVGSISYLGYSNRIVIALTAIVVQGISVVLFPHLSELLANNQTAAFRSRAQDAIKMILFIMFPLAVLVGVLRRPLLEVFLVRGNFTILAAARVAQVLPLYLLGTIWMAAMNLVSRGFFALRDYSTPALAGLGGIVFYFISSGLLIGRFSYVGVGIAYAGFWLLTFVLQTYLLGRAVGTFFTPDLFLFLGKVTLSALLTGIVVGLLYHPRSAALLGLVSTLLAAGVGAGTFFAIGHFVFRVPQCRMLLDIVGRRHAAAATAVNN
jgi:putative peptidoglycan lipid II flippase